MQIGDSRTWKQVKANPEGYIYNDFGTQFPGDSTTWKTSNFNKLHKVDCREVERMTFETDGKSTKYFFDKKSEALDWLRANRQGNFTYCVKCKP
jgi:hypothetical protein